MTLISRSFACAAAALFLSGLSASAATFSFSGVGGGAITDGNTTVMTFNVGGLDGPLTGITLDLEIAHTYLADLVITLERPGAVVFTIADTANNGEDLFLLAGNDYTFTDSGVDIQSVSGGATIPHGDYRTSVSGGGLTVFNSFVSGLSAGGAAGTWTLRVFDQYGADSGTLAGARLNLTTATAAVPEPGSAMLNLVLGSMGIALTTRRRRR